MMVSTFVIFTLGALFSTMSVRKRPQDSTILATAPRNNMEFSMTTSCSLKPPMQAQRLIQQPELVLDGTRLMRVSSGDSAAPSVGDRSQTIASRGFLEDLFIFYRLARIAISKVTTFDVLPLLVGMLGLYPLLLACRHIQTVLSPMLRRISTSSITVSARSSLYKEVLQWVNVSYGDRIRILTAVPEDTVPKFRTAASLIQYELGSGCAVWIRNNRPWTWKDSPFPIGQWIHLSHEHVQNDSRSADTAPRGTDVVRLTCFGWSSKPLKDFLEQCTEAANAERLSKFDRSPDHERSRSAGSVGLRSYKMTQFRRRPAPPVPEDGTS